MDKLLLFANIKAQYEALQCDKDIGDETFERKTTDWRIFVPEFHRFIWPALTVEERMMIVILCQTLFEKATIETRSLHS